MLKKKYKSRYTFYILTFIAINNFFVENGKYSYRFLVQKFEENSSISTENQKTSYFHKRSLLSIFFKIHTIKFLLKSIFGNKKTALRQFSQN
jgi:hypothetical protein